MRPKRIQPGPGQESVWDYPRPPRVEPVNRRIRVRFRGVTIADSRRAQRVVETSHPPVYYIPPEDIRTEHLRPTRKTSFCEFKGLARYHDVEVEGERAEAAAWSYPDPVPGFESLRDHVAFYAHLMESCHVDDERVAPQPGNFYGGWVTSDVVGPFKGGPGSWGW